MKKTILLALVCAISAVMVHAQTEKGNVFVGATLGNASFGSETDNYNYTDAGMRKTTIKNNRIIVNPTIGWFVTNHLIVGANLGVNYIYNKNNSTSTEEPATTSYLKSNTTTVDIGPMVRYYFFSGQPSSTMLFVQANGSVGTGGGKSVGDGSNPTFDYTTSAKISKVFTYDGGGSIGVTHFIQKNVGVDLAVGYLYTHEKSTSTGTQDRTGTGGVKSNVSNNYDLTTHSNALLVSAGFHWFLPTKASSGNKQL